MGTRLFSRLNDVLYLRDQDVLLAYGVPADK